MSSDPTDAELASFSTLDHVATWAGVPGDNVQPTSARKALYTLLGAEPTQLPRIIGVIDEATFVSALGTWQVASVNVGLAVRSSGLLFRKGMPCACGYAEHVRQHRCSSHIDGSRSSGRQHLGSLIGIWSRCTEDSTQPGVESNR